MTVTLIVGIEVDEEETVNMIVGQVSPQGWGAIQRFDDLGEGIFLDCTNEEAVAALPAVLAYYFDTPGMPHGVTIRYAVTPNNLRRFSLYEVDYDGDSPLPERLCSGSGKPVGAGSRCESCGTSFGFPHRANLVVGRAAPTHANPNQ